MQIFFSFQTVFIIIVGFMKKLLIAEQIQTLLNFYLLLRELAFLVRQLILLDLAKLSVAMTEIWYYKCSLIVTVQKVLE